VVAMQCCVWCVAQSVMDQLPLCRTESLLVLLAALFRAFNVSFYIGSQLLLKVSVFSVFARSGGDLTPRAVFTFLALIGPVVLTGSLFVVRGLLNGTEAMVAIRRIQVRFLCCVNMGGRQGHMARWEESQ